ncbi:LINE-1 reverse transcriptase like [Trifolium medium]|uniref:LINE-1 reverse transcriptase like n=1 Tax=Trifolium medium TaxID=97028 RepID=A0A392NLI2_9FABA|nr:LINE-1 reverse transcriptase like [Trifolium medium]
MYVAANFLNCKLGKIPFIYLGLPVGANPRKEATWEPVIEVLHNRLNSWKNRFVSLGGRVILINSVLAAIPIFYLSFMKMPIKVWKRIVAIQRNFLWGGANKKTKLAWVKWVDVCRPKERGGLGIRNLRLVNVSLLTKWRWRLLTSQDMFWVKVLKAKYGGDIAHVSNLSSCGDVKFASLWWKDLCSLGRMVPSDDGDWCSDIMIKKLGNGGNTRFWHDLWMGPTSLCHLYPRLFSISLQTKDCIETMGERRNGVWFWDLKWRRRLFV